MKMNQKIIGIFFMMLMIISAVIPVVNSEDRKIIDNFIEEDCGCDKKVTSEPKIVLSNQNDNPLSVMKLDKETQEMMEIDYNNGELAFIDPNLEKEIQNTESFSILDFLEYDPVTRTQGYCGNCWAWPCTAILSIALNVQEGIKDRLSVMFINTCGEHYTRGPSQIGCCEGGNIQMFADFYSKTSFALPWSNYKAHWHDDKRIHCWEDCYKIEKTPNYPIYDIDDVRIPIHGVTTEEAIYNIKNILHQNKGVYFAVGYPDFVDLGRFRDMWSNEGEDDVYDLDFYCGNPWNDEEGVGHAMLIYGYNDEEGTENDYWMVLNSWGTTDKRPNGLLKWEMDMDYECTYSNYWAFGAYTLNVSFDPDPEAPDIPTINGPSDGKSGTEYTFEISAVDPQGDDVYIWISWGTGFGSGWKGPYSSGEVVEFTHTWSQDENYIVRAKAKDTNDNESIWASFEFRMAKSKEVKLFEHFIETLIENFPMLGKIYNLYT